MWREFSVATMYKRFIKNYVVLEFNIDFDK